MTNRIDALGRIAALLVAAVFAVTVTGRLVRGHEATARDLDSALANVWAATVLEVLAAVLLVAGARAGGRRVRLAGGTVAAFVMAGAFVTQLRDVDSGLPVTVFPVFVGLLGLGAAVTALPSRSSGVSSAGVGPSGRSRPWRRRVAVVGSAAVAVVVAGAVAFVGLAGTGLSQPDVPAAASLRTPFDGSHLLVASDVDMVATAYADGILQQLPGATDTLTVVDLPWDDRAEVTEIPAPNAVTGWPDVVAASPDGTRAYVIETDASPAPGTAQLPVPDFAAGSLLTVVDLTGARPEVLDRVPVGDRPLTLDVSPDGRVVAISFAGGRVGLFPADDITAGEVVTLTTVAEESTAEASSVVWHPSGEFLAVGLDNREVSLHRVERDPGGRLALPRPGPPLATGETLSAGRFTPDGNLFVGTDIRWDTIPRPLGQLLNPRGDLVVVAVDTTVAAAHEETARVPVGQSPEGMTLSLDGRFAVTVDMGRTYLPRALSWFPGADRNQLTLVELAPDGSATVRGEYGFDGVLPEDAVFDAAGDTLAVATFHDREEDPRTGGVTLWNLVTDDGDPRLEPTPVELVTPRGAHSLWATR